MPMNREPGEKEAGQRDERKLDAGNPAQIFAVPDADARNDGENAQEDSNRGENVADDEVFVEAMVGNRIRADHDPDQYAQVDQQCGPRDRGGARCKGQAESAWLRFPSRAIRKQHQAEVAHQ